jgi:flagellar protein FliL
MMSIKASLFILLALLCVSVTSTVYAEDAEPVSIQYHGLKPPFVANFGSENGKKLKFLKADISVRVSSGTAITEVMNHDALVRHQIVMLLSRQSEKSLSSSAGQEKLRKEALKIVQETLGEETGDEQIDDLLFTSFVVQR